MSRVKHEDPFQLISWSSHCSRRFAKSKPAAEILAASKTVDEAVLLKEVLASLFGTQVQNVVKVDSKDLCHALSSKEIPVIHPLDPMSIYQNFL